MLGFLTCSNNSFPNILGSFRKSLTILMKVVIATESKPNCCPYTSRHALVTGKSVLLGREVNLALGCIRRTFSDSILQSTKRSL